MNKKKFINKLEKKYGVTFMAKCRGNRFWEEDKGSTCRFTINWAYNTVDCALLSFTSKNTQTRHKFVVMSDKNKGDLYKMVALHELGHCFCDKEGKESITKEINAWNWAFDNASNNGVTLTKSIKKECLSMLRTYIDAHRDNR